MDETRPRNPAIAVAPYSSAILIGGPAGCGKSTLAKEIARKNSFALYDKDTLTTPLVEELLLALNSPHGRDDRHSEIYLKHVRPLEYACLMNAVMESLALGIPTIAVAPFLREFQDPQWRAGIQRHCEEVQCIWVTASEEVMRQRLTNRAEARDRHKLENWSAYMDGIRNIKPLAPFVHVDRS